jgi:hypothetical protein
MMLAIDALGTTSTHAVCLTIDRMIDFLHDTTAGESGGTSAFQRASSANEVRTAVVACRPYEQ